MNFPMTLTVLKTEPIDGRPAGWDWAIRMSRGEGGVVEMSSWARYRDAAVRSAFAFAANFVDSHGNADETQEMVLR